MALLRCFIFEFIYLMNAFLVTNLLTQSKHPS